jgi:hypothetical protein
MTNKSDVKYYFTKAVLSQLEYFFSYGYPFRLWPDFNRGFRTIGRTDEYGCNGPVLPKIKK